MVFLIELHQHSINASLSSWDISSMTHHQQLDRLLLMDVKLCLQVKAAMQANFQRYQWGLNYIQMCAGNTTGELMLMIPKADNWNASCSWLLLHRGWWEGLQEKQVRKQHNNMKHLLNSMRWKKLRAMDRWSLNMMIKVMRHQSVTEGRHDTHWTGPHA